jgi:ribonuclease HII
MEGGGLVVGVDEAGVGALMGVMVAGAVALADGFDTTGLCDSKKMSAAARARQCERIRAACHVGVGVVTNEEIDVLGMAKCRRLVLHRAIDALVEASDGARLRHIVVDGTLFEPYGDVPHECVPKADETVPAVSAASIVAKHTRDSLVTDLCAREPQLAERYGWAKNMGYPSPAHLAALRAHGPVPTHHRMSFKPCQRSSYAAR